MTKGAFALAIVTLLAPPLASAQLFKCKGPDGRIVYSDTRCEASDTGALKVTPMATTLSEREKAQAEERAHALKLEAEQAAAARKEAASRPPAAPMQAPAVRTPYELTGSDQDRLRDLEVSRGRLGASAEQKTAADLEMSSIRSGRDARLAADARARRDSLHTDLASADARKRREALSALRSLYNQ